MALKFSWASIRTTTADPAAWRPPPCSAGASMHWGGFGNRPCWRRTGINGVITQIHALETTTISLGEGRRVHRACSSWTSVDIFGFYNLLSVGSGLINHGEDGEAISSATTSPQGFRLPERRRKPQKLGFLVPVEERSAVRSPLQRRQSCLARCVDVFRRKSPLEQRFRGLGRGLSCPSDGSDRATRRWIQG